tara:strand:- start:144 stop:557 length:414 start_codon:yes stop_codon:yes gene_type:complete
MLSVTDQEIQYFKKDVTDFNNIEKQISELKIKIKPFQEKIKELTKIKQTKKEDVLNFMDNNQLDVCNTDEASYEMKETKNTKTISKGDVYDRIYKFFSEEQEKLNGIPVIDEKAKYLHNYIYVEGRETTTVKTLKAK